MRVTYEDFKKELLNNRETVLPEELKSAQLSIEHVDKLNHSYDALMIRMPGSNAAASFELDGFYESHKGETPEQMIGSLREVLDSLDLEKGKMLSDAGEWLENYDNVKDSLYVRCSNAVTNAGVLQSCPHNTLGDLAFTAHVGLEWQEGTTPDYTTAVTDRLLDVWGIEKAELFHDAVANSVKRLPANCRPLSDVLIGLSGSDIPVYPAPDDGLYVLTNNQSMDGAAVVIYPGLLDEIRNQIGDFYMIPSSVHEFLILSDGANVSIEALEAMVRDVNSSVLREEEFLSNRLYHYDGKAKVMEPAHDFVKRRALEQSRELSRSNSEQMNHSFKPDPKTKPEAGLSM